MNVSREAITFHTTNRMITPLADPFHSSKSSSTTQARKRSASPRSGRQFTSKIEPIYRILIRIVIGIRRPPKHRID